jgi:hypothetical protein
VGSSTVDENGPWLRKVADYTVQNLLYEISLRDTGTNSFVETSYYRLYTTSNTISMNAITRAWRLQLEECREEKARAS